MTVERSESSGEVLRSSSMSPGLVPDWGPGSGFAYVGTGLGSWDREQPLQNLAWAFLLLPNQPDSPFPISFSVTTGYFIS